MISPVLIVSLCTWFSALNLVWFYAWVWDSRRLCEGLKSCPKWYNSQLAELWKSAGNFPPEKRNNWKPLGLAVTLLWPLIRVSGRLLEQKLGLFSEQEVIT